MLCAASTHAESVLNLLVENDVIAGNDRHYTSGVALNYVSGLDEGPRRLRDLGIFVPGLDRNDKMHVSLSFGHEIYTPQDITSTQLLEDQRPYAGHLYVGAGFITENPREIETWRLSLGVVGPNALGEQVQNGLHRKIGVDEAQGWENQLGNEWVASLAYEKKWLNLARTRTWDLLQLDLIPHFAASVGNSHTYASTGAMLRLGRGLDHDYGPPRVRPSLPVSQFYKNNKGQSWYLFVGLDTRLVGHNIFLDGNLFRNSHSIEKEWFVTDVQAGFVINHPRVRLSYHWVLRSREFKSQQERDLFSSLSLSVHF